MITWSAAEGSRVEGDSRDAQRLRARQAAAIDGRVLVGVVPEPGGSEFVELDRAWSVHAFVCSVFGRTETDYVQDDAEAPPEARELMDERTVDPDDTGFEADGSLRIY